MSLYDRVFKPRRYTLPSGTVVEEKRSRAPLIFAMSSYRWNEVGAILLGLIILVLIIEWISAKIRVKLARG